MTHAATAIAVVLLLVSCFTAWRIVAVPAACVIGRDGKVAWRGPGDKLTEDILLNELARK